tara:strand:+ start:1101 stop:1415 length:315 start_codon:yes stop_codon:yes gene_type:complete
MFDVGLQRRGSKTRNIIKPAMSCDILSGTQVTIYFTDQTEFVFVFVSQNKADENHIDIKFNKDLVSKMMTDNILSLAFEGKKYQYNVLLKPNQGREKQDVMNCL